MRTGTLLNAGIAAGPIFVGVVAVQLATRDGFDLARHPISLLSLGPGGWVQIANFVLAGVLCGAFALGLSRVLRAGPGRVWLPRLMAVYGAGLVLGGVFVADAGLGFPPGTPDTDAVSLSWHGAIHAVAAPLAFLSLVIATVVMARRDGAQGRRGWAAYSAGTAAVLLVLLAWPDQDGLSWRLALAVTGAFAWVTAVGLRERAALLHPAGPVEATPVVR